MITLFRKEVKSFLYSFTGYVVIAIFLIINGLFLWIFPLPATNILDYGFASLESFFINAPLIFLFLIPAISMRMFADENKSGTIEFLMTKPLSEWQIVAGKYLAGVFLILVALLPTLIYYFSVYHLGLPEGNIDTGEMWGSYIGLFFLGAAFMSVGIFTSSLTDNQIISFLLAVVGIGFFYFGFEFIYTFSLFGPIDLFIRSLGMNVHYISMSRGVIDTRDVIYFLSFTGFFLFLTKISIQSRKW